jgi:hypothetical protein
LRTLNLDYTGVTDEGLGSLPPVEVLSLDTGGITDKGVEKLAKMISLKSLNLYHTLVTDEGMARLKQALPNCTVIYDRESALPTRRKS